jgi:tripartite-type tricarboxylate transporter receptor subunit TctC
MMKQRDVLILGLAATIGFGPQDAPAQGKYPDRPIRLVVPFAPGGETDLIGRLWAQAVTPHLGGTIVVENKAGAGGVVGSAEVARARADGYTLLSGQTTTHVINPIAMSKPPYDPLRDFVPIGVVSTTPTAILVNPSVPASNLRELAALAKASPGKYSFGSAGSGTITNLTGELFKIQAGGLDIQHIPYKGGAPAIQDVIAGHIPMAALILSSTMLGHHRAGKLRILAVNSDVRVRAAPDIPTSIESGLAGMRVQVFNAIFAPSGIPGEVLEALHQATVKAKGEAMLRDGLEKAGAELVADSSPEKAARYIREEIARWAPIVKASGFKIE